MQLEAITKLNKDLREATHALSDQEVRFLVDYYYIVQEDRKRSSNQSRAMEATAEPNVVIGWLAQQSKALEDQIKLALDLYTERHPVGAWLRGVTGIGPVIAAGMLAHIDITKAPTVGHIWRFAGLDPTSKWEKGQRRPWNATLKTLCWKAGQSFMKLSNNEKCYYGAVYKARKQYEIARNESGGNRELALASADRYGKDTEAHKHLTQGKLPPMQIDARARRYAVKLFLSHLHDVWYRHEYGAAPPLPYPIAHLGHAHVIPVPEQA
jgi:hypothetical protein